MRFSRYLPDATTLQPYVNGAAYLSIPMALLLSIPSIYHSGKSMSELRGNSEIVLEKRVEVIPIELK